VGAGDAFCAGVLYGIHEGWSPEESLKVGSAAAAACLQAANTTDGVRSLGEIKKLKLEWS
jgi:sugar/nucleoside kinase (ribokinase family)